MTNRVNVLGVGISVLNLRTALAAIADAIGQRRKGYICVTGVHGVMEAQDDDAFKHILNDAFLCTPDGMPMVWAGRLHGHREMRRVYGPDLMLEVCAWSETSGARHFFYGGADGVAELLAEKLKARFPKLAMAGTFTPPFRPLTAGGNRALAGANRGGQAGYFVGGLEHAQAGKVHGGIPAQAGRDADGGRGRGL